MLPKILVLAGSIRTGSLSSRLAARAVKELLQAGTGVTWISLVDYPMPIYDGDIEAKSGPPENALKLKQLIMIHQGVLIVTPEYNASIPPLLKNTLDWISRVRERNEPPLSAFYNRAFALAAASDRNTGGMYALLALRQMLEIGAGALVLPEQFALARASEAFDEMDELLDERARAELLRVVQRLIEMAQELA